MKNVAKFLKAMRSIAIIALVAVIGFSMIACDSGGGGGGGKTPGGEIPGGEIPGGEIPGGETPGGETPGEGDNPPPQPGESGNPIDRSETIDLGTMTSSDSGWWNLLDSINSEGKYINLDLSDCTMAGTSFNPDPKGVATGKKYIVSIILPKVATSIEAGTTFTNFTNLKSISGANITTIGNSAFWMVAGDSKLETVNFPKVTTIGRDAFNNSRQLKNASFPLVETIGQDAFSGCSALESISFPASAEVGHSYGIYKNPFAGCDKLTFTLINTGSLSVIENGKALVRDNTINTILLAYPSASGNITMNNITSIDRAAFYECKNLNAVSFPQVTSIGSTAFWGCELLQSASFPKVTEIGSYAFAFVGSYGSANLTITMGSTTPTLDHKILSSAKGTFTVKVPAGATGYSPFTGTKVTVTGTDTAANWANGLRGGGWTGSAWASSPGSGGVNDIESEITVVIEQQ